MVNEEFIRKYGNNAPQCSNSNNKFVAGVGLSALLALGGIGLYSLGSNSNPKNTKSIYTESFLAKHPELKNNKTLSTEEDNTSKVKALSNSQISQDKNSSNIISLENNSTNPQIKKSNTTNLETLILNDTNQSNDSNTTLSQEKKIKPKKKQSYDKGYDIISVYTPNQYEQVNYDGDKYKLINYAKNPLELKIKNSNYTLEDISNLIVKKWKNSTGLFSLSSMDQIINYTLNYDNKNRNKKNHLNFFSIISHDSGNKNNGFSKSIKTNYKSSNTLPRNSRGLDNISIYIDPIGKNNPDTSVLN